MDLTTNQNTKIRTFQIVANVTSFLEGGIDEWPANIQDRILEELERKSKEVELPLVIIHSYCGLDYATNEGEADKPFIHVIASEIVAADSRFVQVKSEIEDALAKVMADFKAKRNKT